MFEDASEKLGIPYGMIEKDFWVCWVLSRIFGDQNLRGLLRFKGGTSLSKVFHLIKRFSEDIDLILCYGYFAEEIEEMLYHPGDFEQALAEILDECAYDYCGEF